MMALRLLLLMLPPSLQVCVVLLTTFARSTNADDVIETFVSQTYDWDSRSSSVSTPCVNIPRSLTLCENIGYHRMRLPNLLGHDTMSEISSQTASWVPVVNLKCHPDSKRFFCSLYCPICLSNPIYPCRSLCEKVKKGCEKHMMQYGFPWPPMFACDKFPNDNGMCVEPGPATNETSGNCRICEQVNTVENILNNFCQSTFAVKAKLKRRDGNRYTFKVGKIFKATDESRNIVVNELMRVELPDECCRENVQQHKAYFVMGTHEGGNADPIFIMPWVAKESQSFKKSVRMLKALDCSNVDAITLMKAIDPSPMVAENSSRESSLMSSSSSPSPSSSSKTSSRRPSNKSKRRGGRKRGQNRNRH